MRGAESAPKSNVFFSNSMRHSTFCHFERSREISHCDCVEKELRDASAFLRNNENSFVPDCITFYPHVGAWSGSANATIARRRRAALITRDLQGHSHSPRIIRT